MILWWLIALLPAALTILFGCAKDRKTVHTNPPKSSKSSKSRKGKSGSKSGSKSDKSSKKSSKSKKSGKSRKSSKSSKSGKSKSRSKSSNRSRSKSVKPGKSTKTAKSLKNTAPVVPPPAPVPVETPIQTTIPQIILTAEPHEFVYKTFGGLQSLSITNPGNQRRAFKVKCSDNQLYRVNPVFGIIEPGQSAKIDILRHNGNVKTDKLVIISGPCPQGSTPENVLSGPSLAATNDYQAMVVPLLSEV